MRTIVVMRRTIAVLFWILLGALAAGGSVGYFFFQANADRAQLTTDAETAREEAAQAKRAQENVAKEANAKISEANKRLAEAAEKLKQAEAERALRASAISLEKPLAATLKTWTEAVSVPLGVSFRVPPGFKAVDIDHAITLQNTPKSVTLPIEQFLSISPYQAATEAELLATVQNSSPITYLIQGHLFTGTKGAFGVSSDVFVLRLLDDHSTPTHLLWARSSNLLPTERLLQVLATLNIR